MRRWKYIGYFKSGITWGMICCFLGIHPIFAQHHYNFYSLKIDDGLAHNDIYALYQDKAGYIWIGAGTKLQRFDGTRFLTYEHQKGDPHSLPFGDIRSITEDHDGALWIGTDGGGVARFENGIFETFIETNLPGALSNNSVDEIIALPDGSLCMATWGGGINFYKEGVFTHYMHDENDSNSISNNNVVTVFYDDAKDRLWAGTWGGGVCYLQNGKIHRFPISKEGFNSLRARTITKTADGAIWIGSWGDGLFRYQDGHFTQFSMENGALEDNNILSLGANGDKLWIGTWGGGVTLFENGVFTTYRHNAGQANTLSSDYIESSIVDDKGNLWVGTKGSGICKMEKTHFTFFEDMQSRHEDVTKFIRSIAEDNEGRIWIAGITGIYILDGPAFLPVSQVFPQIPNLGAVNAVYKTQNGDIWIGGSTGVGLFQFDGQRLIDRSEWANIDFRNYFIHNIMQSADGSIWISSDVDAGFIRIRGDSVTRFFHDPADAHSPSCNNFYSAIEAKDGSIWGCTSRHGINVYKNGQFTRYRADESDSLALSNDYVNSVLETRAGDIWIASENGLNRYDPVTDGFQHFYKSDGLLDDTILSLLEDEEGNIWMGTHSGISKMNPQTMSFQNFDHRSGVKGHPFHQSAILQSSRSKEIYMGGVNGLMVFHPDTVRQHQSHSAVRVTNVLVNNTSVLPVSGLGLKADQKDSSLLTLGRFEGSLAFEYSDMNFGAGEEMQYAYRIKNLEVSWNLAGNNFVALYSNLPPGQYVFQVRSSVDGDLWSTPHSLKFQILPYWWETIWFRVILAILLVGLVPLVVILRLRMLERKRKKLEKLVEEKTEEVHRKNIQILQKSEELSRTNLVLKKTLLQVKELQNQQVIFQENERQTIGRELHDSISSALFGIRLLVNKSLSQVDAKDSMIKVPVMVDELIGQVIRDSQIILNNLSASFNKHTTFFDSLNDLVTKSEKISQATIHLDWKGPANISELSIASNVFRIIQEALANAIRHACAHNISISVDNQANLKCTIVDDGVGFDANDPDTERYGLQNIRERAAEINAKLEIQSGINTGTRILLEIKR